MIVQGHTLIPPEPGTVTTHTLVRTTRNVQSKGYLVGNLLTNNIKIIALDHFLKSYPAATVTTLLLLLSLPLQPSLLLRSLPFSGHQPLSKLLQFLHCR